MANRTDRGAATVRGTNPQYLIEKIIRMRIYDARYWKEECFALTAELVVDKGMDLRFVGGIYGGNVKPTPFLCIILKMLQIQPDKDIIIEFLRQEEYKYIRALGAMYFRLTAGSVEIYKYLEPLLNDYRKLRWMNKDGRFEVVHMDGFIDQLLREERFCDIQLPRLQKRQALEETTQLEPRVSALEEDLNDISSSSSDEEAEKPNKSGRSPEASRRRRSRSRSRERRRSRSRSRERRTRRSRSPERSSRKGDKRRDEDRKRTREDSYEREIRDSNELRAKLGLAPLEQ